MSETKIIPVELRKLVCCELSGGDYDDLLDEMVYQSQGVIPLDLGELRKTQRRVAALLNNPSAANDVFSVKPKKRVPPSFCYVCSKLNPYRHLFNDGYKQKCNHVPAPPHPSFLTENSSRVTEGKDGFRLSSNEDEEEEDDVGDNMFDTHILNEEDLNDPNQFSLPPVFSNGQQDDQHKPRRVVPTVSENTFVKSNYRNPDADKIFDENCRLQRKRQDKENRHFDQDEDNSGHFVSPDRLPKIGKERHLVAIGHKEDDEFDDEGGLIGMKERRRRRNRRERNALTSREGYERVKGHHDGVILTSRSEPGYNRTMTLDSERTGGSLRIDEDYVPMSVTIKKLTENDIERTGQSAYQEYSDVLSSSPSGSLGVSRETSLEDSEFGSPTLLMARLRSASWCECQKSKLDTVQCPECKKTKGHEKWCVSAGNFCQSCHKPIKKLKAHVQRQKSFNSGDFSGVGGNGVPADNNLVILSKLPSRKGSREKRECSGKEKPELRRSKNVNSGGTGNNEQRVRFDDTVQQVSPDNKRLLPHTALDYENLENCGHEVMKNNEKPSMGGKATNRRHSEVNAGGEDPFFQKRPRPKSLDDPDTTRLPHLNADIHRTAYILALRDAQLRGAPKKKRKSKKSTGGNTETQSGTIFSYFPSLKRPLSEPEKGLNLGLKQDVGRKVKPRNLMKHIFGKIKLGDYYPGGQRWRELIP